MKNVRKIINISKHKSIVAIGLITVFVLASIASLTLNHNDASIFFVSADSFNQATIDLTLHPNETKVGNSQREQLYKDDSISSTVKTFDKRVYVLDQYFKDNDSPLYGTATYFVAACKLYNAPQDCMVVAAIARNETNLCKYNISAQMHNCWGWGGAGSNRVTFPDFKTAIFRVTEVLVKNYGIESMNDPTIMQGTFCGPQDECIGWGESIKILMNELENYSKSIGMGSLLELRTAS
jgi:hypothetical protein